MFLRRQFYERISQTSEVPQGFEISRAEGCWLYDQQGVPYLDLISGFGVNNLGHQPAPVIEAIQQQSQRYLHSNVFGEHIQRVQIQFAERLAGFLPPSLNSFYFLSSGSEAIDAALKLARLATQRVEWVVCKNAYHGSTLGAESLRSDEAHKSPFLPLIPGVRFIEFGNLQDLDCIGPHTAAVITEVVQAEAGIQMAESEWWHRLRQQCTTHGALLVLDEIQTGMGRTGSLFSFMKEGVVPDLLVCGKALGAGLPLSAVIAERQLMQTLFRKLPLAHITTFGGHPLSCAAALAGLELLTKGGILDGVESKGLALEKEFIRLGFHNLHRRGLFMALDFKEQREALHWMRRLYDQKILAEGFLFHSKALRIAPPLIIGEAALQQIVVAFSHIQQSSTDLH